MNKGEIDMSKLNLLGIISLIGGGLLLGFQGLATFMGIGTKEEELVWKSLNLIDVFGETNFDWIDGISIIYIKEAASYLTTVPLFILCFCLAAIFFILKIFIRG